MPERTVMAFEVVGDDNSNSHKLLKHTGKGILKMMVGNKRPGNHILVHYDDGTSSQHLLREPNDDRKKNSKPATFRIELPEGVET